MRENPFRIPFKEVAPDRAFAVRTTCRRVLVLRRLYPPILASGVQNPGQYRLPQESVNPRFYNAMGEVDGIMHYFFIFDEMDVIPTSAKSTA